MSASGMPASVMPPSSSGSSAPSASTTGVAANASPVLQRSATGRGAATMANSLTAPQSGFLTLVRPERPVRRASLTGPLANPFTGPSTTSRSSSEPSTTSPSVESPVTGSEGLVAQRWTPGSVTRRLRSNADQLGRNRGGPVIGARPQAGRDGTVLDAPVDMPVISAPPTVGQAVAPTSAKAPNAAPQSDEQQAPASQPLAAEETRVTGASGIRNANDEAGRIAPTAAELDELASRLYEPIASRLRAELLIDRERRGQRTDAW